MHPDDTNKTSAVPNAPVEQAADTPTQAQPAGGFHRRTFLKAAALGTAAAVAVRGGSLGSSALAHNDTKSSCTANDIEVIGGQIINEPCTCTPGGTFEAVARFTVINQNNATRKCITLHFGGGGTLSSKDVLLTTDSSGDPSKGSSNIGGLGTVQTMYAKLGTLPCNFGQECYTNSVIAFQTAQNQSDSACAGPLTKYPGGQCRRQTICITGFSANLECVSGCGADAVPSNCNVGCGGTLYLRASAIGGTDGSNGTYTFTLKDPDGNVVDTKTGSSPQCFAVTDPKAGTYTLEAKDSQGCSRTAQSGPVSVTTVAKPTLSVASSNACTGVTVFDVTPCPPASGVTYSFTDCSGNPLNGTFANCKYTVTLPQGQTSCVRVTASNGTTACDQTDDESVTVPAQLAVDVPTRISDPCSGLAEYEATATGGTAPYQYSFNGGTFGSSNKFTVSPRLTSNGGLDTSCRTLSVTAKDANGCTASNSTTYSQCVSTTTGCTP